MLASILALLSIKVNIETSSQEQPIPDKTPDIAPSQTPTKPVSDPIPEKEAVEKKEQQDQSIPEANPVENKESTSETVADEAPVQALVRLETKKQETATSPSIAEQIQNNAPIKETVLNELK